MAFHDVRFPAPLSMGSSGGPERRTEIITLNNGFEQRNSPWAHSRRRYDAGLGVRSLDDLAEVTAFFEARNGQLHAFRWKDWTDYKSCAPSLTSAPLDQLLGKGDGVNKIFRLSKAYSSGAESYSRPILKPVEATVSVAVRATAQDVGLDYSIDYNRGEIHFVLAPAFGVEVTAGFHFDVPVRFDSDRILTSASGFAAGEIPSIPVIEVRV